MEQHSSFTFDSVRLLPDEQIGLHWQESWELAWVVVGSGIRTLGDDVEPFFSGEIVLVPPNMPHCWYFDGNVTDSKGCIANVAVTFGEAFLQSCSVAFPELANAVNNLRNRNVAVKYGKVRAGQIIALLTEMQQLDEAGRIPVMIKLLLIMATTDDNDYVAGRLRRVSKEQRRAEQVCTYVICNHRRNITLADVAAYVGMNRAAFCVFFKKHFNVTFINYLNLIRLEQACLMLRRSTMSVSEICYHVGFNNLPYFHRVFKRVKGMTPAQYRNA